MWHKYMFTTYAQIPSYLEEVEHFLTPTVSFLLSDYRGFSMGQKALKQLNQLDDLSWSVGFDFDYNIILWHLATSVCYYQEHQGDGDNDGEAHVSKCLSDYMMYLLAICPTLVLADHSKSFWLDHAYKELKVLLSSATEITDAASKFVPNNVHEEDLESCELSTMEENNPDNVHTEELESRETLEKILQNDVLKLTRLLKQSGNKWQLIRDVWIEMLVYAVVSCPHVSHLKQLGKGIEFFSLIWLFVGLNVVFKSL